MAPEVLILFKEIGDILEELADGQELGAGFDAVATVGAVDAVLLFEDGPDLHKPELGIGGENFIQHLGAVVEGHAHMAEKASRSICALSSSMVVSLMQPRPSCASLLENSYLSPFLFDDGKGVDALTLVQSLGTIPSSGCRLFP